MNAVPIWSAARGVTSVCIRLICIGAFVLMSVGCSYGELPGENTKPGADSGGPDNDIMQRDDVGTDTSSDPKPWSKTDESVFTMCGAAGVSSKNGVTAIQCYGPMDLSGSMPSGTTSDGTSVTWQPGSTRVITP